MFCELEPYQLLFVKHNVMLIRTLSATIDGQASWQDSINKNVNLQTIYENIIKVSFIFKLYNNNKK